jgi:hypothetical protein
MTVVKLEIPTGLTPLQEAHYRKCFIHTAYEFASATTKNIPLEKVKERAALYMMQKYGMRV